MFYNCQKNQFWTIWTTAVGRSIQCALVYKHQWALQWNNREGKHFYHVMFGRSCNARCNVTMWIKWQTVIMTKYFHFHLMSFVISCYLKAVHKSLDQLATRDRSQFRAVIEKTCVPYLRHLSNVNGILTSVLSQLSMQQCTVI